MYWLPYSSHTSHYPSQTYSLPWISYATQKLMLDSCKMVQKQSEVFHTILWHFFPILKQCFLGYRSSKVSSRPDWIFEIHQLWQSGFSRVYSNCCCRYGVAPFPTPCRNSYWKGSFVCPSTTVANFTLLKYFQRHLGEFDMCGNDLSHR